MASLYIVATPIGNLKDITFRAVETLKTVDKIYCEDTRRTKLLLTHFQIDKPVASFHQHSPGKITAIVNELNDGQDLAYVTDAGTPGIQDPGGLLVAAARQAGITIVPVPGVSAVTTLLSAAGINSDHFRFAGYVPTKKGRQTFIKNMLADDDPVVFFETAPRIQKLLDQIIEFGGEKRVLIVGRELTKLHEQITYGFPSELKKDLAEPKGEMTVILTPLD